MTARGPGRDPAGERPAGDGARAGMKGEPVSGVRVLVGTRKGAFVLSSDGNRQDWEVSGPHFAGWEIYHVKGSPVDPNRLYASQSSGWFGQVIQRSDDGGQTWDAVGSDFRLRRRPGHAPVVRRDAAPLGVRPGLAPRAVAERSGHGLRRGRGRGPVPVHRRRPGAGRSCPGCAATRPGPSWQPGAGGMCLHTIILGSGSAPGRMFVAISAAGAFRSTTRATPGGRSTRAFARRGSPTEAPRSATACTASPCTRRVPPCSTCRSTGT